MKPPQFSKLPTRFWDKVTPSDHGCWEWTGAVRGKLDYGSYFHEGKTRITHRLVAAEYYGGIPEGKFALHHCDNPVCLRPVHLYFGDQFDNMKDMADRGRTNHVPHPGEENGNAKLRDQDVRDIRLLYSNGGHTHKSLAKIYRVSQSVVGDVITGRGWSHVAPVAEPVRCDVVMLPCKNDDVAFRPACSVHLIRAEGNKLYWGKFQPAESKSI